MSLAEIVENKKEALRVEELARILDVSIKEIYKLAAKGQIPRIKIANCVRFDPHEIADWIKNQSRTGPISNAVKPVPRRVGYRSQKSPRI